MGYLKINKKLSHSVRFGSRNDFLLQFPCDSAWLCVEKPTKHIFQSKINTIWVGKQDSIGPQLILFCRSSKAGLAARLHTGGFLRLPLLARAQPGRLLRLPLLRRAQPGRLLRIPLLRRARSLATTTIWRGWISEIAIVSVNFDNGCEGQLSRPRDPLRAARRVPRLPAHLLWALARSML